MRPEPSSCSSGATGRAARRHSRHDEEGHGGRAQRDQTGDGGNAREVDGLGQERPGDGAEDMRDVLSAGVSRRQVEDALAVCAAFNTTDRLADAFGFELLSPEGFESGARHLLKRGYR